MPTVAARRSGERAPPVGLVQRPPDERATVRIKFGQHERPASSAQPKLITAARAARPIPPIAPEFGRFLAVIEDNGALDDDYDTPGAGGVAA